MQEVVDTGIASICSELNPGQSIRILIDPGAEHSETSMKKRLEEYLKKRKKEPFKVFNTNTERITNYKVENFEPEVDRKGSKHKTAVSVKLRRTHAQSSTVQHSRSLRHLEYSEEQGNAVVDLMKTGELPPPDVQVHLIT